PRVVFIPTRLARMLAMYLMRRGKERGNYLFCTRAGRQLSRNEAHRVIANAGRRASLELHPHLLRHTYISLMLNVRKAPLKYVQENVGHTQVTTTMRY